MHDALAAAAPVEAPPRRSGALLAVACATQFICVLDAGIVNVALPPLQESLGLSATGLQWVVSSYTLTFAGFLLLGGRLGDLWGRRRTFVAGLLVFAVASLAAGLAEEGWHVVAARFVQGVGGAVLAPTALSLITTGFPQPRAKAKALSLLTAAAASGGALGAVIGGLLTGLLSWRWVFFVNVPLCALLLLAAVWALPARPPRRARGTLDLPGSISVTAGTAALVGAVILGEERGFASAETLLCAVMAVVAFGVFVLVERRSEEPVVPLDVFGIRPVTVANGLSALVSGVLPTTMFFLALYLQRVLGMDPLQAGLALTPGAVGIALGARGASRWMAALGPRGSFLLGTLVSAGALAWLSGIDVDGRYTADVLVPLVLAMAGFGAAGLPLTVTAMSGLPPERSGLASGLLNTSRQVGSAVGLAALVAVASTWAPGMGPEQSDAALTAGFGAGFLAGAGVLAVAALAALALPGRKAVDQPG
ncbi:MFS transporter [Geodermatophilus marinus]|uniref:MFS transporter n=1 Tax=Geodermatophilus sp. LHW52908 TaxID=2303986 RepID=UPI000E3BB545|nr:MFS transporter [Geodermatophilus sp. LHW52908]RFU18851.1 MFS transporter [Geodermatophilus sp. LHW52908]